MSEKRNRKINREYRKQVGELIVFLTNKSFAYRFKLAWRILWRLK